jgi:hypothetical protein
MVSSLPHPALGPRDDKDNDVQPPRICVKPIPPGSNERGLMSLIEPDARAEIRPRQLVTIEAARRDQAVERAAIEPEAAMDQRLHQDEPADGNGILDAAMEEDVGSR